MKLLAIVLGSLALSACGGGGGGGGEVSALQDALLSTSLNLTGTAATGEAITNAAVSARCAVGSASGVTGPDGVYKLSSPNLTGPCLLEVTYGTPSQTLHSLAAVDGIANITPLTELISAKVLAHANLTSIFSSLSAQQIIEAQGKVAAANQELGAFLQSNLGFTLPVGLDVIRSLLKAAVGPIAGDAHDDLLDRFNQQLVMSGQSLSGLKFAFNASSATTTCPETLSKVSEGIYRGSWWTKTTGGSVNISNAVAYVSATGAAVGGSNMDGQIFSSSDLKIDPCGAIGVKTVKYEIPNYYLNGNSVLDAPVISGGIISGSELSLNLSNPRSALARESIRMQYDIASDSNPLPLAAIAGDYSDFRASGVFFVWNVSVRIDAQGKILGKKTMRMGSVCNFTGVVEPTALNQKGVHFATVDMTSCDEQATIRAVVIPRTNAQSVASIFIGALPDTASVKAITAFDVSADTLPSRCTTDNHVDPCL